MREAAPVDRVRTAPQAARAAARFCGVCRAPATLPGSGTPRAVLRPYSYGPRGGVYTC